MNTINGRTVVSKTEYVSYYGARRVFLAYPPLAQPKHDYCAWFDEDQAAGVAVKKSVYDALDVPATLHDSALERKAWEEEKRRASFKATAWIW